MSLQTTYNTTTTSLQRELDQLRQSHQTLRIQLRELEMGNDDHESMLQSLPQDASVFYIR